jgi:hypothetical protein
MYVVTVGDGSRERQVLAKVRRADGAARHTGSGVRPRLSSDQLSPQELTAFEYDGLRSVFDLFGSGGSSSFRAVRPLAHLPSHNAILMDFAPGRSARQVILGRSPLALQHRSRREDTDRALGQAGGWLRTFQDGVPPRHLTARQPTRHAVVERFVAYHDFLSSRLGEHAFGDVAKRGADLAEKVLPDRLPLAVGHGDYAPRNLLVDSEGLLTVVDPLPRWAVPRLEDLARFLVGIRLLGLQVHTHGIAFRGSQVDHFEQQVLRGYFAHETVPTAQVRCYELLLTLDKWSALIDNPARGWRGRLRASSLQHATGYIHGQARRLLDLADEVVL